MKVANSSILRLPLFLGLTAFIAGGGASIVRAQSLRGRPEPASRVDAELVQLASFEVVGTRPQALDHTTLKLPSRIIETPRSVSVIDATRIREQEFQTAADLLFWVPGINSNGDSYHFYARGFRMAANDWKVDGFAGRVIGGSYTPNLFGVENVTVLKGPAGLLYGASSAPGGQINLVTKKPRESARVTMDVRSRTFAGGETAFGDHVGSEVEFDATGPVTSDRRLLYRILASVERSRMRPVTPDDNQFYRASFTYKLDGEGRFQLTPLVEWSREERTNRGPSLSPSSSRSTADGRSDYTLADATPRDVNLAAGARIDTNLTWGTDFSADVSERWRVNASARIHTREYDNNAWNVLTATLRQANPSDARSWIVDRQQTRAALETDTFSTDVNTTYEFPLSDDIKTLVLAGWNARWQESQAFTSTTGASQSAVNVWTGQAAAPLLEDAAPVLPRGNVTETYVWNTYLQAQTSFFHCLIATVSGGFTGDETEIVAPSGVSGGTVKRDSDVTPNLGLVYLISPKVSVFASYSTSYALPSATAEDAAGLTGTFDPTEGENYEAGVKAEFWGEVLAATASVFRTELNGVLVLSELNDRNSNGNQFYRQLDSGRRSQGVELEFAVAPIKAWETTFTYAYIDAYNRTPSGGKAGRAEMTPRHAASVYSRYAFTRGALNGWSVRAGLIWQDERLGGSSAPTAAAPDPLWLESFYRVDAGLGYRVKDWSFALTVENVTDTDYLIGGSTGLNLERANPRTLVFRAGYSW